VLDRPDALRSTGVALNARQSSFHPNGETAPPLRPSVGADTLDAAADCRRVHPETYSVGGVDNPAGNWWQDDYGCRARRSLPGVASQDGSSAAGRIRSG
jgi:hypothetical protein